MSSIYANKAEPLFRVRGFAILTEHPEPFFSGGNVREVHHFGVHWCVVEEYPATNDTSKTKRGSARVSVSFTAEDYAEVKRIARAKRVSAAWVVRDAVTHYLDARNPLFTRRE